MNKFSKFVFGSVVAVAAFVAATSYAATVTVPPNLMQGSSGQEVMDMQTILGITADGAFGPMTKSAVMTFQAANGLTADGVVGPMTAAKLNAVTPVVEDEDMDDEDMDDEDANDDSIDGGAGDLNDIDVLSTYSNEDVKEGEEEARVMGFELEADEGSDLGIMNIRLELEETGGLASNDLEDYIESVSILMGDEVVAEVDVEDFSEDNDVFTKSISLDGAIVNEDDAEKFYVEVTAQSNIDSDDIADGDWRVTLVSVRFEDGDGAITTESDLGDLDGVVPGSDYRNFQFEDESSDDDLSVKSSSSDPESETLEVEEDADSDDFMVFAFKLDVDEDSSDVEVEEMDIVIDVTNPTGGLASITSDDVIKDVFLKIDGEEFDFTDDTASAAIADAATDSATFTFEFDSEEFMIDAGDTVEVEVYASFNEQDGNYDVGTEIEVSVDGSDIDAIGADDFVATGSQTGEVHTLSVDAPMFEHVSDKLVISQTIDGVALGEEDIFLAEFVFEVTAGDEDIYLSDDASDIAYTLLNGSSVNDVVLDPEDSSIDETDSYKIDAGETEEFTLSFYIVADNLSEKVTIDSFAYGFDDGAFADDETMTSGLEEFETNTVYLAK